MPKTLFEKLRTGVVLNSAWRRVRENGISSSSRDTRDEILRFDADAPRLLRRIQTDLRRGKFEFDPQIGILKVRRGKRPRPLVLGTVRNRIVQRALLDLLQEQPAVKSILQTPTSFGGIGGRGRDDAIQTARGAIEGGATHFLRSDIREFFTRIPREVVFRSLEALVPDIEFLEFARRASETELANLSKLGPDASFFPLYEVGVAQGCCLSPLIGNLLLADFDASLNGRGVTCLRYIDDLLLLGPGQRNVAKAFESAQSILLRLGLDAYVPEPGSDKAKAGLTKAGFDFLGCSINPGFIQPSRDARERLLLRVRTLLRNSKRALRTVAAGGSVGRMRFVQTLDELNKVIKGWGQSYSFCNSAQTMADLDAKIDEEIAGLFSAYQMLIRGASSATRRRLLGVQLLND
jgi:RNA-directed DNA polymerase